MLLPYSADFSEIHYAAPLSDSAIDSTGGQMPSGVATCPEGSI